MKLTEIMLQEMPTIVISGPGSAEIRVWASQRLPIQHWKRIKVFGPNNTTGTVPWNSKKLPEGNPIAAKEVIEITYMAKNESSKKKRGEDDEVQCTEKFSVGDISKVDADLGQFIFTNGNGAVVKFTRVKESFFDYKNLIY